MIKTYGSQPLAAKPTAVAQETAALLRQSCIARAHLLGWRRRSIDVSLGSRRLQHGSRGMGSNCITHRLAAEPLTCYWCTPDSPFLAPPLPVLPGCRRHLVPLFLGELALEFARVCRRFIVLCFWLPATRDQHQHERSDGERRLCRHFESTTQTVSASAQHHP